ncbi:RluA family pseudouridine synthase [Oceanirhabdus seepicola]|uniref:Pseudouridine synthase n=1 Tax=Oceanirhabdus seepicola TaxID=2828781 RepID=A0A9J6P9C5_9CLOT|nr:RluA family pseudouridine synthase [Oceanirhabdus seepicola]MCM1992724.1 RluA family pseudouridine synthase [Oceanirhabdus seepicola]
MCKIDLITEEEQVGYRLDMLLGEIDSDRSRSFYQKMIERGEVLVNGKSVKCKYKVKLGDRIVVEDTQPIPLEAIAEDIPINIIYEDSDIVVVNKEQGMVVHPAPGNYTGTLVNALLYHCDNLSGINGVIRPGIVHRIDKDTSGILVVAKNDYAHMKLGELFHEHEIEREYYALVEGVLKSDEGVVDKPLGRDPKIRVKMAIVKDGKRAVTHYSVIERYKGFTLVKCKLETGRTHQIRVHMASLGHPLVGDPIYGIKKQKFNLKGQMLHAKSLAFVHPKTEKYVEFNSELPEHFTRILSKLEKKEL